LSVLFQYGLLNLLERRRYVVPTILAIGATAAAVVALFAVATSAEGVVRSDRDLNNAVVLGKGSMTEQGSSFSLEEVGDIKVLPGVAEVEGAPEVSVEYVTSIWLKEVGTQRPRTIRARGVDATALQVHSHAHLASGRLPRPGEQGVVVGRLLLDRFVGINEGGGLTFGLHQWPVLGILESGDAHESELWCDRTALMQEFHHPTVSVLHVRLAGPSDFDLFAEKVQRMKGIEAVTEPELARRRLVWSALDKHIWMLRALCALLAFGAIFASINALHGSFQSRIQELATLRAIGYTRGRIFLMALQESVLIALAGMLVGLPCAVLAEGRVLSSGAIFYRVHLEWTAWALGAATVCAIGLVATVFSAFQIQRLTVLRALRAA
jgi:putative ABC transport system permease protein